MAWYRQLQASPGGQVNYAGSFGNYSGSTQKTGSGSGGPVLTSARGQSSHLSYFLIASSGTGSGSGGPVLRYTRPTSVVASSGTGSGSGGPVLRYARAARPALRVVHPVRVRLAANHRSAPFRKRA